MIPLSFYLWYQSNKAQIINLYHALGTLMLFRDSRWFGSQEMNSCRMFSKRSKSNKRMVEKPLLLPLPWKRHEGTEARWTLLKISPIHRANLLNSENDKVIQTSVRSKIHRALLKNFVYIYMYKGNFFAKVVIQNKRKHYVLRLNILNGFFFHIVRNVLCIKVKCHKCNIVLNFQLALFVNLILSCR